MLRIILGLMLCWHPLTGQQIARRGAGLPAAGGASYFTPAFVQNNQNAVNSATTISSTLNASVSSGNSLVAYGYCPFSSGSPTLSFSDDVNGAYTAVTSNLSVTGGTISLWVLNNAGSGDTTGTITASSGCDRIYIFFAEFTNLAAGDQVSTPLTGLTSNAVTTTVSHELILGLLTGGDGGTNATAGSGYTLLYATNTGAWNPAWEYKVVTSTGSNTAVFVAATGTVQSTIVTIGAHTNP